MTTTTTPAGPSAGEVLRIKLLKAVGRAEDWASTMPAKEAVKLRPSDWHAVCNAARAFAATPPSAELDAVRAERDALRGRVKMLEEALRPFEGPTFLSTKRTLIDFNRYGLRCSISPMEIASRDAWKALRHQDERAAFSSSQDGMKGGSDAG